MTHLDNESRTIVMNNYYQCPRLAHELLEGTHSLDTPAELKTAAQVSDSVATREEAFPIILSCSDCGPE